jgi:hypothetical protein
VKLPNGESFSVEPRDSGNVCRTVKALLVVIEGGKRGFSGSFSRKKITEQ